MRNVKGPNSTSQDLMLLKFVSFKRLTNGLSAEGALNRRERDRGRGQARKRSWASIPFEGVSRVGHWFEIRRERRAARLDVVEKRHVRNAREGSK